MDKKSFILHLDSLDVIKELTDNQIAELIKAIRDYHLDNEIKLTGLMKAIFIPFENQFKRDAEKYNNIVERNKINGSKGGRPKNPSKPKKPTGLIKNQSKPKKADSDNGNDNENDSVNKKEKEINKKPTFSEFSDFVKLKCGEYKLVYSEIAIKMKFDSWSNADWVDGNGNKIKNWKSKIINTMPYILKEKRKRKMVY